MSRYYNILSEKSIPWILLVVGLVVHFAWFGHPNSAVFDEVHFGKFISAYFTGQYYFDIHPPLGKLILAGWGKLFGYQPGFSFESIGEVYPDHLYMALRFLPALAGALLPLVVYGVARRLKIRPAASFLAGILVALDNALLVQSRLILLDSFLLLFGFGALYCYLRWRDGGTKWLLVATGLLAGASFSIKWTGLTFLALIVIMELVHLWQDRHGSARKRLGVMLLTLGFLPFALYYLAFAVHFALLPNTGTGDAFMTPAFQHGLVGNSYASDTTLTTPTIGAKFLELNVQMYLANQRLTATHPYSSKWYTWPFMERPIFYWVKDNARIYLVGNPAVWWLSTVALFIMLTSLVMSGVWRSEPLQIILVGAWLMNMLPFIGIDRVMFLYHYFTALIWAILMLAVVVDQMKKPQRAVWVITGLALVLFVFFAPLSYGLPLSDHAYHLRVWLGSWQ